MDHSIVFLDRATIPEDLPLRPPAFVHRWADYPRTRPEHVVARCRNASIVIVNKVPLTGAMIEALPGLRMIAVAATGTDRIDLDAAAARRIVVSNVRGYATTTVPEHTFALILALRRSLPAYRASVLEGAWQRAGQFCYFDHPIHDLAGAVICVIGAGSIGGAVARLAEAFGMTVIRAGRKGAAKVAPDRTPFADAVAAADIITLHCPLTDATRNLIGAPEFALMSRKPLLINTARGGLVDEAALSAALEGGILSGAAFDVASAEPPPTDHPLMRLAHRSNVILTPHVAWASREAIAVLAEQLIGNIEAFVAGKPRNIVGR
ncbi:MAG: D-2-hydroxyacid dehydrogenase [Alphaproteobacteria bacterium]